MELHVAQADINTLAVDAVMIPCTSMGNITEPVRSLLKSEDGDCIEEELKAKAPLAVGAATLANADGFAASNAILVPIKKHPDDDVAVEHLRRAVKAGLIAANMKGYESLALPPMVEAGTETTPSEAARAVVQEIRAHRQPFPQTIYLVDLEEKTIRMFEHAIQHASHAL